MRFGIAIVLFCLSSGFITAAQGSLPEDSLTVVPVNVAGLHDLIQKDSGNVVLVNVWATWCKWCKEEMPGILELKKKFEGKGFRVILVSADDIDILESEVKPTLTKLGVHFPSFIINEPTDEAFMNGMNPDWNGALPTSFIYDRSVKLAETMVGDKTA
ncbi:MAG TPA: TlpA disulfide reductase family protein, partial [Bacteroidota bacterium]|nr:TlpA disulfide reductase family protein [Bacteroidota bacterium]